MVGRAQRGFLSDLDDPRAALAHMGPNWFASVMGTGIVAVAGATLPVRFPGQQVFTTAIWLLSGLILIAISAAWAMHWVRFRDKAKTHIYDPVQSQFLGAPPMAIMVVGIGTLYLGPPVIGQAVSLWIAWVLGDRHRAGCGHCGRRAVHDVHPPCSPAGAPTRTRSSAAG